MSYYGGTVTVAGRDLITRLIAGDTIQFTKVVVGAGEMPEGVEPIDMKDLVQPVADGTSTKPIVDNGSVSMIVEYRNDLNGGLKNGFWLREFGIFAKTSNSEEILLYYATLGDSPQPVSAYQENRVDIRRYPISIALEVDAEVKVLYDTSAFVTSDDVVDLVESEISDLAKAGALVTKDNVEEIVKEEIAKFPPSGGYIGQYDLTLKASEWKPTEAPVGGYEYVCDVKVDGVLREHVPVGATDADSDDVSDQAGVRQACETFDGYIRFYAKSIPEGDISASITLFGPGGGGSSGGGVAAGDGLEYGADGRLRVKTGNGLFFDEKSALSVDKGEVVTDGDLLNEGETAKELEEILNR